MFSRLPTLKSFALTPSALASLFFAGVVVCSCSSTRRAEINLQTVLHTSPGSHQLFDSNQITNALLEFGGNNKAAFSVLKAASSETNTIVDAGRIIDTNRFVRAGAIYGIGQLGGSVPEAAPFLWELIYSPSKKGFDRSMAFRSLQNLGLEMRDVPSLAKLLASPVCDQNILTKLVPETISELIETNPQAAKPYLQIVENLLDDANSDTQFRAALALVRSEGAANPKIFSALHALYHRPNDRFNMYYKNISAGVLANAGPGAKALVPDLLELAKLPDENYIYQSIAKIAPELGSQFLEIAQALKEQQRAQMWVDKWKSGVYTMDELRAALKEQYQAQTASKHLAEMGASAKIALPDLIQALWGKDEGTRNEILADIHKIDPQVTVTKIDVDNVPFNGALSSANSVLEKMPASPQNRILTDSCSQMIYSSGWVSSEELAVFTNGLAAQAPIAYREFLEGLKPPTCAKPVQK